MEHDGTYNTSNKQRFKRIRCETFDVVWIPQRDFTFKLVSNLLSFLPSASFQPLFFRLHASWRRSIFWILQ